MEHIIHARSITDAIKIVEILLANYYEVTISHSIESTEICYADRYDITFCKKSREEEE